MKFYVDSRDGSEFFTENIRVALRPVRRVGHLLNFDWCIAVALGNRLLQSRRMTASQLRPDICSASRSVLATTVCNSASWPLCATWAVNFPAISMRCPCNKCCDLRNGICAINRVHCFCDMMVTKAPVSTSICTGTCAMVTSTTICCSAAAFPWWILPIVNPNSSSSLSSSTSLPPRTFFTDLAFFPAEPLYSLLFRHLCRKCPFFLKPWPVIPRAGQASSPALWFQLPQFVHYSLFCGCDDWFRRLSFSWKLSTSFSSARRVPCVLASVVSNCLTVSKAICSVKSSFSSSFCLRRSSLTCSTAWSLWCSNTVLSRNAHSAACSHRRWTNWATVSRSRWDIFRKRCLSKPVLGL